MSAGAREDAMVVLRRHPDGTPAVWCDPEIADVVQALNAGGIPTVASCSGHGARPGNVVLADGREMIVAADWHEARGVEAAFLAVGDGAAVGYDALKAERDRLEIERDRYHRALDAIAFGLHDRPDLAARAALDSDPDLAERTRRIRADE